MKKYFLYVPDGGGRHVDFVEELNAENYDEAVECAKDIFTSHDLFCDMIGNWDEEDPYIDDGTKILVVTEELPLDLNSWFVSERDKEEKDYEERKREEELAQLARLQKKYKNGISKL